MPKTANPKTKQNDTDCRLGICFRPKWARRLASPKLLAACYGFLHLIQGMTFMHFVGTMSTFERHFQLKSEALGQVMSAAEIGIIVVSVLFSYWCGAKDRPRWIGGFTLITALGCFIHALPYFIFGAPDDKRLKLLSDAQNNEGNISRICVPRAATPSADYADTTTNTTQESCIENPVGDQGSMAVAIYFIGVMTFNGGQTVMWVVGTPYLDDSVTQKNSPFYIAIIAALRTFGPMIGFLISSFSLSFYVDLSQTDITPHDPRWVGAWWLGYVIMAPAIALAAFLIAQFPELLPSKHVTPAMRMEMTKASKEPQIESTYGVETSSRWNKIQATFIDFCQEMWSLLKNRHWLLRTASGVSIILALEGYMIYLPKYLEQQFHLTASQASAWSGTAILVPLIVGQLCVGFFMKHFLPSPRKMAVLLATAKLICASLMFGLMFIQCSSSYLVGIHENSGCDVNCDCTSLPFQPVCVDERRNFLSGCHVGCTSFNASAEANKYVDCSCSEHGYATPGFCSESCSLFPYYMVLACLAHFVISVDVVSMIFLFRCVPPEKKTMSMGIFYASTSLLAFVPSPLIFSAIIDVTCILWNASCDADGACLVYDIDKFRHLLHGIPCAILCVAFVFDALFAMKAHEIDLYGEDTKDTQSQDKPVSSSSNII